MTRARRGERREAKKVTLYYDSVSPRQSTINIRELNGIFICNIVHFIVKFNRIPCRKFSSQERLYTFFFDNRKDKKNSIEYIR